MAELHPLVAFPIVLKVLRLQPQSGRTFRRKLIVRLPKSFDSRVSHRSVSSSAPFNRMSENVAPVLMPSHTFSVGGRSSLTFEVCGDSLVAEPAMKFPYTSDTS